MRDARIEPLAGDVVIGWVDCDSVERRVISVAGGKVTYATSVRNAPQVCSMATWRDWCRRYRARVAPRTAMQHARRA